VPRDATLALAQLTAEPAKMPRSNKAQFKGRDLPNQFMPVTAPTNQENLMSLRTRLSCHIRCLCFSSPTYLSSEGVHGSSCQYRPDG